MSYILEALKKAQAERQLGATPTIHAPTLDSGVVRNPSPARWKPLALAAGVLVAAGALALWWRQPGMPQASPAAAQAAPARPAGQTGASAPAAVPAMAAGLAVPAAASPVAVAAAPAVPPPVPVSAAAAAPAATATAAALPPAALPTAAPPVTIAAKMPAAPVPAVAGGPAPGLTPPALAPLASAALPLPAQATPASMPSVQPAAQLAAKPAGKPAPLAAAVEPQEEPAPWLRELPEPIQRSIPPIAMGGYMYSRNPADRLLLIDKVLRREGEEVAPGLVLEKLQPKAAVFTFKGYRYRVPY